MVTKHTLTEIDHYKTRKSSCLKIHRSQLFSSFRIFTILRHLRFTLYIFWVYEVSSYETLFTVCQSAHDWTWKMPSPGRAAHWWWLPTAAAVKKPTQVTPSVVMGPGGDIVPNMDGKMVRLFEKNLWNCYVRLSKNNCVRVINLIQWF